MKTGLSIAVISAAVFLSCKKDKTYFHFTDKQLVFVNYSQGQQLKFIDTNSVLQPLKQDSYKREFREQLSFFGGTAAFTETYQVSYIAPNNSIGMQVHVASPSGALSLEINSYWSYAPLVIDSLQPALSSLVISGKTYDDVYLLKLYKNALYVNSTDTATLFINKQYGVIQLRYPNGKTITRAD